MKIICNNGEGRERNPYQKSEMKFLPGSGDPYIYTDINWKEFEQKVEVLPIYDQSGKLFTGSGEYNAKLIEQHKRWEDDKWLEAQDGRRQTHIGLENRQIYRLTDHIELTDQEKEEIKTSKTSNLIEKEKVIELLEAEIEKAVYLSTAHKVLLNFLTKIKEL